jgi:hypothetical protein
MLDDMRRDRDAWRGNPRLVCYRRPPRRSRAMVRLWLTQERRRLRRVGSDGSLWDLASDTGSRHSPHSAHARASVGGRFHWCSLAFDP